MKMNTTLQVTALWDQEVPDSPTFADTAHLFEVVCVVGDVDKLSDFWNGNLLELAGHEDSSSTNQLQLATMNMHDRKEAVDVPGTNNPQENIHGHHESKKTGTMLCFHHMPIISMRAQSPLRWSFLVYSSRQQKKSTLWSVALRICANRRDKMKLTQRLGIESGRAICTLQRQRPSSR